MDRRKIINMLIERDGMECAICGCQLTEESVSVDRIIPRSLGGGDDIENMRLVCPRCNAMLAKSYNEYDVEHYLVEILKSSGNFRNIITDEHGDWGFDIIAERKEGHDWRKIAIEVKAVTALTLNRIRAIIARMNAVKLLYDQDNIKLILAVFTRLSEAALSLLKQGGIEVWDAKYIAKNFAVEISRNKNKSFQQFLKNSNSSTHKSTEEEYIDKLKNCAPGQKDWSKYQKLVGEILSYLFCPPLSQPLSETPDYSKTNRRDFIFPNYSESGFWAFLRTDYKADYIVVDAKNYTYMISKSEVLQVANYLKAHGTGLFALIVSRNECDAAAQNTMREIWMTDRKLILNLQDNDLEQMLLEKMDKREPEKVLRQKIDDFRLSF